ncbi:heme-binding domain-containing protein [Antarcticibacterium sp. 1MA-6-2]|uniref:heme-binding domain-containing protein n=1 Tax=Antarcticibacterium sp. 1MA-6-2 TaxID=2908210 RepID=UPI001F2B62F6|nr:heme-binding domain-containing protein [Antarcticibacterium sp. 1MA-6-2]UJH91889.1 heme-binding domain-containing protein [Antarcticibacterium sp. 1MA-6-2]
MKFLKIIGLILLVVFVGIQFIPTNRNTSDYIPQSDFTEVFEVPENINTILQTSCYDCHSNNTNYPWYNKIQPLTWYLNDHIEKGKEELNFSEFGEYSSRRQSSKLRSISSQVEDGEMPLSSYTLVHWDAKLSAKEKEVFIAWMDSLAMELR